MIHDVATIVWKEWRELVVHPSSRRGTIANIAIMIAVLGVFLPARTGLPWLESGLYVAYWAWVPSLLVSTLIADSFAGERERHTLETLLASRLPDHTILFGKIAAAVIYGWSVTLTILFVGVVAVNLSHWQGKVVFYQGAIGVAVVGLSFLLSLTTASTGALASLHAATVRQAQTTLNLAIMVAYLLPAIGIQFLPQAIQNQLLQTIDRADLGTIMLVVVLALLALNGLLLSIARAHFQRARLLLD